jgi:UDP-N-acetyl-D-glucosamine dehydrogenase
VPVASAEVAEASKLLENIFRAVNIALVNEMKMVLAQMDVDIWDVVRAASTKPFGFMPFYPGPGLGGHCIPVDPQFLAWKLKTLGYTARFIQLATEVNLSMPGYVLGKIADALNETGKPLSGSRVLLLGVAYKAGVGDTRESPALDLIVLLKEKGADVAYHDPYVARVEVENVVMESVVLDDGALSTADCVVITTDHSSYDWRRVVDKSQLVVDTRNATGSLKTAKSRVARL